MISSILHFCAAHPFLLLFLMITIPVLLVVLLVKRSPKRSIWLLLLPVIGVIGFIKGSDWNTSYVFKNGVNGTGVVISIEPTSVIVNHVPEYQYNCLIKTKEGKTLKAEFVNNNDIFYPQSDRWMLPAIGEEFSVKYIVGDEDNFIILTNDQTSDYSNKVNCTELLEKIVSVQAAYNFDPSDKEKAKAFRSILNQFLKGPCDENIKTAYRLVLEQMKD